MNMIIFINSSSGQGWGKDSPAISRHHQHPASSIHPTPSPATANHRNGDKQHSITIKHNRLCPPPRAPFLPITSSWRKTRMPGITVTYECVCICHRKSSIWLTSGGCGGASLHLETLIIHARYTLKYRVASIKRRERVCVCFCVCRMCWY